MGDDWEYEAWTLRHQEINPFPNRQHARISHEENLETQSSNYRTGLEQVQVLHEDTESEVKKTAEVRKKQAPTSL